MRQQQNTNGPVIFEIRGFRLTVEELPDLFIEGMEYALKVVDDLVDTADKKNDLKERECYIVASTMIRAKIDELKRN